MLSSARSNGEPGLVAIDRFLPDKPPRAGSVPNFVLSRHTPLEERKCTAGALVVAELPRYIEPPSGQTLFMDAGSAA